MDCSRYCLEEHLLGKGSFGCIKRGIDSSLMEPIAVKIILNPVKNHHIVKCCIRELVTLSSFRHKNVVAFRDCYMQGQQLYLVMELCCHDLYSTIVSDELYRQLTSEDVVSIAFQLLEAVTYIHSRNIIHRDIKPSNILVGTDGLIKLCDFGMSREVLSGVQDISQSAGQFLRQRPPQPHQNIGSFDVSHSEGKDDCQSSRATTAAIGVSDSRYTEYVVTRWYRAPEVILSCGIYDFAQDMWSVGCTLGEILKRRPLFPGTTFVHQLELIVGVLGKPRMIDSNFPMTSYGRKYLRAMPQINGIGLVSVLSPQMMSNACYPLLVQLIGDLLSFDPNSRSTAGEALLSPLFRRAGVPGCDAIDSGIVDAAPISFDEVNAARHDDLNVLVNLLHTRVTLIHGEVGERRSKSMPASVAEQQPSLVSPMTDREDSTSSCSCLSTSENTPLVSGSSKMFHSSRKVVKLTDSNSDRLGGNRGRRRSFRLRALPLKNVNVDPEKRTAQPNNSSDDDNVNAVESRAAEVSSRLKLLPKVVAAQKEPLLVETSAKTAVMPREDIVVDSSSIDDNPKDAQFTNAATWTGVDITADSNAEATVDAALPSSANNFQYTNLFLQRCLDGRSSWRSWQVRHQKLAFPDDSSTSILHSNVKPTAPAPLLPVICEHGHMETSALDTVTASKENNEELMPMIKQDMFESEGCKSKGVGRLTNMFSRNGVINRHVTSLHRLPSIDGRH